MLETITLNDLPDFYSDEDAAPAHTTDDRSVGRRLALQILYEVDTVQHNILDVIEMHERKQSPNTRASRYMRLLVLGAWDERTVTDKAIQQYAPEHPLAQIAAIDRNILRIAIYEFAVTGITPIGAAIDEAVELAKLFGADGSPSFINGVLGSLADDTDMLAQLRQPLNEEQRDDIQTET